MDTSFLDCKRKHMLQKTAPPDKFGALYHVLHIQLHGFNSMIDVSGLLHFGSWYFLNFLETVWVPLKNGTGNQT